MSTYENLEKYLSSIITQSVPMTFAEIEKIVGRPLPPSAYKHRPWWSNNTANSAMTRAWIKAGWETSQVDMGARKLIFRRARRSSPAAIMQGSVHSLTITGLSSETIGHLQQRANLTDQTLEKTAAALLAEHAKPSLRERVGLATRIRLSGTKLHHVDIPALIREDRDSR